MALPMTVEQDVHDLRERVKYLEGWKDGESERYGRLERDVGGIKDEIATTRNSLQGEIQDLRASVQAEFRDLRASQDRRFEHLEKRFDRVLWFMMVTLGGVLAQLAMTVMTAR
jgi:hypothetical protein